ncbi:uncharacterized protein J4E87_006298 [Alternaria ethzedia]|uniref:uncharacterized protein n=1 Tax=Alternaria ethzedia TaxID=181014 RepID=UPI0020C2B1CB|nr:uncharacterized protein J4E87_006298 [Alternaria ethzedia]KAI4622731.1 hypothetical protein J4E87_006298 [Alternaria ethzedia]
MTPGVPDDATAQTLNYALGNLGGRQKSWMTPLPSSAPAQPPIVPAELTQNPLPFTVRSRGRPRKQPRFTVPSSTHAPAENLITRPTVETEPQPLSNSTSPQLPNVVAHQNSANHGHSAARVLPSPTPSEETSRCPPPVPHETAPAKRVNEGYAQQMDKRRRSEAYAGPVANPTNPPPDLPRRPSGHYSQIGSPMLGQMGQTVNRSPSLGMMASPQLPQGMLFQDPRLSRTPPQPYSPYGLPQAVSQDPVSRPVSRSVQSDNTPTTPLAPDFMSQGWYTKKDCLQILGQFQASAPPISPASQDRKRFLVLQNAVELSDWPYLTMHQCYCLMTHAPHMLPPGLKSLPGLQQAQRILHDVLDANHILSPSYLHFFSHFPYPMQQIAAMWPATFEYQAQLFRQFVDQSPNYNQLKAICEHRRFPPLVRELVVELRIHSLTFQRLLFTAFLRCICRAVVSNPNVKPLLAKFENDIVGVFEQNQNYHYSRHASSATETPEQSQQLKHDEERIWGSNLRALVEAFEANLRKNGASLADHTYSAPQPQQQVQTHQAPPSQPQQVQAQSQPQRVQTSSPAVPPFNHPQQMPPRTTRSVDQGSAQAAIQQSRGPGRPPTRPAQSTGVAPPPRGGPLLPAAGWQQPQQRVPNPARFGLHQAHLRSPVLRAQSQASPLYTFCQNFLKPPTRLSSPGRAIEKWTITLTPYDMQRIGKTIPDQTGGPGTVNINETTKFARLRCVKWPEPEWTEERWAVADTSWIPHSYYTLNDTPLEPRKKIHYGKDMPIDLTGLLKEGENVLEIAVMARSGEKSHLNYMLAIEAMVVSSHESIVKHCLNQSRVPADKVLQGIKNKLSAVDDDEISVVESTLTIGLFDPFSQAKMCDIPVRSKACPHNDCFDLETFLQSRPRKGDASVADQWKCPICKSDARPQMLFVDGFMEEVKKQLEAHGRANTRHILVRQDGKWIPKAEVREGVSSATPEPVAARRSVPAEVEIIDLSD